MVNKNIIYFSYIKQLYCLLKKLYKPIKVFYLYKPQVVSYHFYLTVHILESQNFTTKAIPRGNPKMHPTLQISRNFSLVCLIGCSVKVA